MTINYKNGKIYKIEPTVDHDEGDVYIGSTTKEYLSQRMVQHRDNYKTYKKGNVKSKTMAFNLVPCIIVDKTDRFEVKDGKLGDIAPTILSLMGVEIPKEMTGNVLI
jgi:2,3-bisphosphoglycerate-independent phosphoglycerate mutase